jgi:hypothetical protein
MWWAIILLEGSVLVGSRLGVLSISLKPCVGENAVVRNPVVHWGGLEIVSMGKGSTVRVSKVKRHVLIALVNGVEFFAVEELGDVMLDNRVLRNSALLGPGGVEPDDISEGEDVFELFALKGVLVNVDGAVCFGDAASHQLGMGQ